MTDSTIAKTRARLALAASLCAAMVSTAMAQGEPAAGEGDAEAAAEDRVAEPPAAAAPMPAEPPPPPADYNSPKREECTKEIEKDVDWFFALKDRYVDLFYFGAPDEAKAAREHETIPPNFQEGYASPMRAECEAELAKDAAWRGSLQSYFGSLLAYEFHSRNAGAFTTNKKHVIMAYAAILVILVIGLVGLFFRQRKLLDDIERLRQDVDRAAAE